MLNWLSRLGVETAGFDRAELIFSGLESKVAWVLLVLLFLSGIVWAWSSVKDLPSRGRRILLLVLQSAALVLLALIFIRPAIRLAKVARVKERVAILIDASASMTLPGSADAKTRAEETFRFLERRSDFFKKLGDEFSLSYYSFDSALHSLSKGPEQALESKGENTDLLAALSGTAAESGGLPLAGVIMISDGADLGRLKEVKPAANQELDLKGLLQNFAAPVNTVAAGVSSSVKDLAIVDLRHDDYGFVHNPFEVRVKVHAEGGVANEVTVVFKQGERVLASKTMTLAPGQKDTEAFLSFTPRQVGKFMFSVEVPPVAGELTTANNVARFPLKVLRDKVRILYVVGNPSWDERFLRQTLKKDPAVDLVSFYILREHWDNYQAREDEVSLIPFPTDKLFREELDTFDMVIWQDFRGELYMFGAYPAYMAELNRYIKLRGGALLMIGGHRAFLGRGLMNENLEEILPVVPTDDLPNYTEGEIKPALTEIGLAHPIMKVGEGGEDAAAVWAILPALEGFNRVKQAAAGALVLATHPTERGADGNLLPLIAVREVGQGRVMTVMTDYSWVWSLPAAGQGLSNKPYQRFWENAMRWLLQDPEMRLITLSADSGRVKPKEPVTMTLEVLDETYHPSDSAEVKVEVLEQPPDGKLELPAPEKIAAGKYRLTVTPQIPGGYVLRASATLNGRSLGHDDESFEAAEQSAEWTEVAPRPDVLAAISKATGATAIPASGNPADFIFHRQGLEQVTGSRDLPLWDNLPVFLAAFGLLVLGWLLRRKWGLR